LTHTVHPLSVQYDSNSVQLYIRAETNVLCSYWTMQYSIFVFQGRRGWKSLYLTSGDTCNVIFAVTSALLLVVGLW